MVWCSECNLVALVRPQVGASCLYVTSVAYRRGTGGVGGSNSPLEIPKALQNRAKHNPIVKTVKNC